MIDYDDASDFALMSWIFDHWFGLVLGIAAIVIFVIAAMNDSDCSKKTCPNDAKPKLMENQCLCVVEAK